MTGWYACMLEGVNQHISGILARSRVALFLVPFGRIPVLDKGKDCPYVAFTKLFLFPGDKELGKVCKSPGIDVSVDYPGSRRI